MRAANTSVFSPTAERTETPEDVLLLDDADDDNSKLSIADALVTVVDDDLKQKQLDFNLSLEEDEEENCGDEDDDPCLTKTTKPIAAALDSVPSVGVMRVQGSINRCRLIQAVFSEKHKDAYMKLDRRLTRAEIDKRMTSDNDDFYGDLLSSYLNEDSPYLLSTAHRDKVSQDSKHWLSKNGKKVNYPDVITIPNKNVNINQIRDSLKHTERYYDLAFQKWKQSGQHESIPIGDFTCNQGKAIMFFHYFVEDNHDCLCRVTGSLNDDVFKEIGGGGSDKNTKKARPAKRRMPPAVEAMVSRSDSAKKQKAEHESKMLELMGERTKEIKALSQQRLLGSLHAQIQNARQMRLSLVAMKAKQPGTDDEFLDEEITELTTQIQETRSRVKKLESEIFTS